MTSHHSRPHATPVLLDDELDIFRGAICPMCHMSASLSHVALEAGGDWRCAGCGQQWDAVRLETVAAYAAWAADHDRAGHRITEDGLEAALVGPVPTERLDRRP